MSTPTTTSRHLTQVPEHRIPDSLYNSLCAEAESNNVCWDLFTASPVLADRIAQALGESDLAEHFPTPDIEDWLVQAAGFSHGQATVRFNDAGTCYVLVFGG